MNLDVHALWLRILSAHQRLDEVAADGAALMVALETAAEGQEAEQLGRDLLVALEVAVARMSELTDSARKRHDSKGKN